MNSAAKISALLTVPERKQAMLLLALMVVGMLLEMLGIGMVIPAVTLLMQGDVTARFPVLKSAVEGLGSPSEGELIVGAMVGLATVYSVKNLFLAFLTRQQSRFAYRVQSKLSLRLFAIYLQQPYTFHLQRNSAQLIRNITTDVNLLASHAIMQGLLLAAEALVVSGIAVLLLFIEPRGTLIVGIGMVAAAWFFFSVTRARTRHWGEERQLHDGQRLQHLQQGLGGIKDVLLLGRQQVFLGRYDIHNLSSSVAAQHQEFLKQVPRLCLEWLAIVGFSILVISMILNGRQLVEVVPVLGVFAAAAFRLMPSINRILAAVQTLRFMAPVVDTIYSESQLPIQQLSAANEDLAFVDEISLDRVTYSYPDTSIPALVNVSLTIRHGETVGFVGASGSGKSSLVDVILGLLEPEEGRVSVDGRDIRSDLRAWQRSIGYVPQVIYLTDDTLRRNIAFGVPDDQIDECALAKAVSAAQLDSLVAALPMGLATTVGERGMRLSGGQRQRIGIARALYHDPALLVLDEATSALDNDTERGVMEAVDALHGKKTILVVAHRLSTVENCDRLFRLEMGRLVNEDRAAVGATG